MLAPRMGRPLSHLLRPKNSERERPMALQDIEPNPKLPIDDLEADTVLEADLIKLRPFLRAFAVSLSGKWHLADDLAQETLTKAWRSRRYFHPRLESQGLATSPSFATNTTRSSAALGAKPIGIKSGRRLCPMSRINSIGRLNFPTRLPPWKRCLTSNAKPCSWLERPAFPMKRPRSIRGWPWEQ